MSPASPPARRRRKGPSAGMMGRTALSGALGAFAALGFGAGSHAGQQGGLQGPVAAPGVTNAPGVSTSGTTTDVTLKQSRTIIDWTSFQLDKGETLNFLFNDKSWIVLNRTPGTAVVNGALNGCVVTCGVIGGNVWIYGAEGVIFGPNARVNVGSLLATTTPLTSALDFLAGKTGGLTFTGGQDFAAVRVQAGAQIAAHGGALALVAPEVETDAGSTVSATGVATLAAAKSVTVHFDASAGGNLDLVDFQLPASALTDGTVSATPLAVNGAVSGGSVVLAAVSRASVLDALISVGGAVTATGAQAGEGGSIVLTGAGGSTKADVSGVLTAHGGKIDVTATDVALEGAIDVSAPGGGGAVRLGGGAHGQDATIANAQTVTVAPGATINADATAKGAGGTVTVWSDKATDFHGAITARGGPQGGDGGAAEVSGGWLNYAGTVDLLAPLGLTGSLLLDPDDISITHGGANNASVFPTPAGMPLATTNNTGVSTINDTTINGVLSGANVTVQTTSGGGITFTDAATYTFTGSGKLTFDAQGAVAFPHATTVLQANNTGGLELDAGSAFNLGGATIKTGGAALTLSAPTITVDGALNVGAGGAGGVVTLTATGAVTDTSAGVITAHTLNATSSGAGVDLSLAANEVDRLGTGGTGANGNFTFADTTDLTLTGALAVNGVGALTLNTTTGGVTENAGVAISAGSVGGSSPGAFSLTSGANTYTGVGGITVTGAASNIALSSGGALTVKGAVATAAAGTGSISITGAGLTVTGAGSVHAGGDLSLTSTGSANDLVIGGAVSANATTGTATLSSGRRTTESFTGLPAATGTITAATLSISTGDAALDGANAVAKIFALSATGDVSFTDGQALEFAPGFPVLTPLAGALTLKTTVGGLTLDTLVATGSSLDLEAAGALSTQSVAVGGDYMVKAASFATPAATLAPTLGLASAFSIEQTTGNLALSAIGTPTAAGVFTVKVDAGNVTAGADLKGLGVLVTGKAVTVDKLTATGGNITVTATNGALTLQNAASTGGAADGHTITLKSTGGGVSQTGGTIATQTLDVQGDGVVSLGLANTVGALTHLTSNGALTFRDNVTTLAISNASTGATGGFVSLRNSGSLTITGLSVGTAGASLTSDNAAVEVTDALTLGGGTTTVTAATNAAFDGAVTGPGSLTLHAPATVFGSTVGAGTRLGGLIVDNAATLNGNVSVGAGGLSIGGVATLDGAVTLDSLAGVSLAGATSDAAGTPRALTVNAAAGFSSSAALGSTNALSSLAVTAASASFTGTNKTAALSMDLSAGASAVATSFSFTNSATLLTLGAIKTNDGDATIDSDGAIKVNAAVNIGAGALTIGAGGDLTQGAAGAITAAAVDASSNGLLTLDTVANTVGGTVADPIGQLTLSNGGSTQAAGFLNTVALAASGFTQVGGALAITTQAGTLTTGAITTGGALTLTAGSVTPAGATLSTGALTSPGTVTLKAGSTISAGGESVGDGYIVEATNTAGNAFLGSTLTPTFTGAANAVHDFKITSHGAAFSLALIGTKTITGAFTIAAPGEAVTGNVPLQGATIAISGGSLTVSDLTANGVVAAGASALTLSTTAGALVAGDLTATHGDVSLTSVGGGIELSGVVVAGTRAAGVTPADDRALRLSATGGAITQDPGASIDAFSVSAQGNGGVTLDPGAGGDTVDDVVQLKDTSAGGVGATYVGSPTYAVQVDAASSDHGNVSVSGGDITVAGPVSAALAGVPATNQSVTLSAATGGVRQTAGGVVTADVLTVAASDGIDLESAGVVNAVATSVSLDAGTGVADFLNATAAAVALQVTGASAGQGIEIINPNGIKLTGAVVAMDPFTFARRSVTLKAAAGAVTQTAAGTIDAGSLTVNAQGAITLDQANTFDAVTGATAGGAITLDSSTLTAVGGVSGAGVAITGGTGDLTISGIDGGTGNVSLANGGAITLAAAGSPTPATVITAGLVTGSQRVTLTSTNGAVTQAAGSTIQAAELAVSGTRIGLGEANHVRTAVSLAGRDGVVFGADEADAVGLQVLSATETALAGGGGAGITLRNTGDLTLGKKGPPAVAGVVSAGADQAVALASSAGQVFQAAGSITAGSLTAAGLHGVVLTAGTNTVATVTGLSDTGTGAAGGGGVAYAGVGPFTVASADSKQGNVTLSSTGDLTLSGAVKAEGHAAGEDVVSLTAGPPGGTVGSVLGSGGAVTGDVVTGGAAQDFTLDNAANAIGRLQDVTVGFVSPATVDHALTLVDSTGLTLGGAIGDARTTVGDARTTIAITAGGAVVQDAAAGAVLKGAQLSVSAAGGLTLAGNNAVARVQSLTNTGAGGVTYAFGPGALTVHDVTAGSGAGAGGLTLRPFDLTAAGGDLTLDGALAVGAQTADISAKGAVDQTAGSLVAGVLRGGAAGDFTLAQPGNSFGELDALTVTNGGATLKDMTGLRIAGPLSVHGPSGTPPGLSTLAVTAPTLDVRAVSGPQATIDADNVTLTATAAPPSGSTLDPASIAITGSIRTPSGLTDLVASSGPIVEGPTGSITTAKLEASAAGAVTLPNLAAGTGGTIQIVSLTSAGGLSLTTPVDTTFTGAVQDGTGPVTITGGGALTFDAAVTAHDALTLHATGALTGTGAQSTAGAVDLMGLGVAFSGAVSAHGVATVDAGVGTASFGSLSAGDMITVTGGGNAEFGALTGGAAVSVTAGGEVGLSSPTFQVGGNLSLTGASFTPLALLPHFTVGVSPPQTFTLTETSGALTYATLSAPGDLTVTADGAGGTSPISGGALTSDHGHIVVSGTSLALTGAVTATKATGMGPAIALTARTGAIGLGGLVNAGSGAVTLMAGGAVGETGAGAIAASTLDVRAGGAVTLDGANGEVPQSGGGVLDLATMTATIVDSGPGGVSFTDRAMAVTLTSVTTVGGDIGLTAPVGTLALPATLLSPGALTVSAMNGRVSGGTATAQDGALSITGRGVTLTGDATASAGLSIDAGAAAALLQTLVADGGDLSVHGASIATGDATASGGLTYHSPGAVTAGVLQANGGALALTGGSLAFTSGAATGEATLVSGAGATFGDLSAGGGVAITAGGALQATQVAANGGTAVLHVASAQLGVVSASSDLTATTSTGDLDVATSASAGRDMTLASAGALDAAAITVGRNLSASAATLATIGGLTTGSAGDVAISGQDVALGAPAGTMPDAAASLATGAATTLEVDATRDLGLNLSGPLAATRLTAGRDLTLAVAGGDATAVTLAAGGALSATVTGGSARIGTLTLTGAGPATITADQDVVLGQGFTGATLSIPGDLLVIGAGRDVAVAYPGAVSLAQATAGRALTIDGGGALTADTLTATNGAATLDAASLDVGTLTAGAGIDATTTTGAMTLGLASAAGDLTLRSAGDLQATTLSAGQDLALTAAGALTGGTLTATAGAATLTAASLEVQALTAGLDVSATTTAGALTLHQTTAGRDAAATAAGAAHADRLTAGQDVTIQAAGALTAGALTATAGKATLLGATIDVTTLAAGTDVAAAATTGALKLGQATAGGSVTALAAGDLGVGALTAGQDVSLTAAGALTGTTLTATAGAATLKAATLEVATLTAGTDVGATTTAGPLTLHATTAGRNAQATSADALTLDALTAGGTLTLVAADALTGGTLTATAGAATLTAASLDVQTLSAGTDLSLTTTAGPLTLGQAAAGGDLSASAVGLLQADSLTAGRDITLAAAPASAPAAARARRGSDAGAVLRDAATPGPGDIVLNAALAGRNLSATATGALTANALTATAGAVALDAASIVVTTLSAGTDATLDSTGGDTTLGTATTGGAFTATSAGALTLQTLDAGDAATLLASGTATLDAATVGGDLALTSTTGDAALRTVTMTATQPGLHTLTVSAQGEASIGRAADGGAEGALVLSNPARTQVSVLSVGPGGGVARVDVTGDATLTRVASTSGDVLVRSGGAIVGAPAGGAQLFQAAGALSATSAGDTTLGGTSSSGGASMLQAGGALTLDTLNAGTTAALTSTGAMQVAALTTGADATLTSSDALSVTSLAAGGAATLMAQKALAVVTSLASQGDATLTSVADTLSVGTLSTNGAATLTAQNGLSVTTGLTTRGDAALQSVAGDVTLAATTVGANATLYAHGVLAFQQAFTATGEVNAVAADLDIAATGSLDAPVIRIAARTGDLTLGGAATAASAKGGMTIDDAEFGRINPTGGRNTNALTLYAGNPFADATLTGGDAARAAVLQNTAGGDVADGKPQNISVANLTIDPAKVKTLTLLARNAASVTVSGRVQPSADTNGVGGVDLVIGATPAQPAGTGAAPATAVAAPEWTPADILIEGAIGGPPLQDGSQHYAITTPVYALHSLQLNALKQVLIGGATLLAPNDPSSFVAKLQTTIMNLGGANPISVINVTRGTPTGISPDFGDFNRNIVTTGTLTVRTDGYLVQQNTGSTGQQGGVFLTNPDKAATVLTLGRITGVGPAGTLVPDLIDVSINFVSSSGTLITRQVAATSLGVDSSALGRSDAYRINGCTIGVAGTCTPLPNTISNIHIDKLVEGVQIASEDPPAIDDPTITGAGNEEIWRAPSPTCNPTSGRVCK